MLIFGWIMIFTKIALKSSWRGLHSPILPSLRVLRELRTAFCRNLPTSATGHGSGTVYLIFAYTGPAYIHRSMHAYWQLPSQKRATKSCEVTCRELTPTWCKNGLCTKCLFYGNQWPFYGRKCTFYGRKCTFYGLSTVCLRSLSVTSSEQRAQQISALRLDLM